MAEEVGVQLGEMISTFFGAATPVFTDKSNAREHVGLCVGGSNFRPLQLEDGQFTSGLHFRARALVNDLHIASAAASTYMRRGCTSVVNMALPRVACLWEGLILSEQRCTAGLACCAVQRDLRPRDQCCSRCEEDNDEMEQERCTCRQVLVAAHVLRGVGAADEAHVRSVEALTEALRVCDQPFNWSRGGDRAFVGAWGA